MSREIKFRAWDKNNNQMVYDDCMIIHFDGAVNALDEIGEIIGTANLNCVALQYTGLKDKNGVEIYEGDILKSESSYDLVFWNEDCWSTKVIKRHSKGGWILGHVSRVFTVSAKYDQVIGNMYENPTLLEGSN